MIKLPETGTSKAPANRFIDKHRTPVYPFGSVYEINANFTRSLCNAVNRLWLFALVVFIGDRVLFCLWCGGWRRRDLVDGLSAVVPLRVVQFSQLIAKEFFC